nr:MAG TPA: hypothetical protein [Bacteriophage sp.]
MFFLTLNSLYQHIFNMSILIINISLLFRYYITIYLYLYKYIFMDFLI